MKGTNRGNAILVLKNDRIVDEIPEHNNFVDVHKTCFDHYDVRNDVFELRHSGGNDGVTIHVNLINKGEVNQLLFGSNANLDWFFIDENLANCHENVETAPAIKIKDGSIIKSECIGK